MCNTSSSYADFMETKLQNDLPAIDEDITDILEWGNVCVIVTGIATIIIHKCYSKKTKNLYSGLQRQHIVSSVLQLIALTVYYNIVNYNAITGLIYQCITYLNPLIPIWTACIALKMFSDLYLFKGAEVYTIKEINKFANGSVVVIELYEELMLFYYQAESCDYELSLIPAVRLTSIFLVMSVSVVVFFFVLVYCIRSSQSDRRLALIFLIHLCTLISCDSILVVFKVHSREPSEAFFVDAIFLCARLVIEMIWLNVIVFLNVPLCGNDVN